MKYLAAYALLALSGKKDISNIWFIQKQLTSSPSSETSDLMSLTKMSIDALTASRENPFTNLSPMDKRKSDLALALEPLLPHQPKKTKKTKNNKRRKKRKSKLLLLPQKKKNLRRT